ncbi:MAG: preprotein translocase subunit YajC [Bacteroidia bacterium]
MILLQTTETGASGGLGGMEQFLFFGGIIAIFYFFMIRPQQKRAKEERQFRENLNKGDKVVTIGGIYGQIESIDEKSVLVKVDTNVKLRFEKAALKPVPAAENEK